MEEQSSEGERQSGDEQLAGDAQQEQAGPTGPGTHTIENELAEGQLGIQQLFRGRKSFTSSMLYFQRKHNVRNIFVTLHFRRQSYTMMGSAQGFVRT